MHAILGRAVMEQLRMYSTSGRIRSTYPADAVPKAPVAQVGTPSPPTPTTVQTNATPPAAPESNANTP